MHSVHRLAAFLCTAAFAQAGSTTAPPPVPPVAPPPPGPAYDPIKLGPLTIDIQEKLRAEIRENNFDFNSSINSLTDDSWLLQRFRLGLGLTVTPWMKLYVQGQDIREIDSDRPNVVGRLGAEGDDTFDLLKGYVQLGDLKKGFSAVVGRQFLSYGDQRLVGPLEWLNSARTFDAVRLRYAGEGWSLEGFTSSPVSFVDQEFNRSDIFNSDEPRDQVFSGLYLQTSLVPFNLTTDFYVYHKSDNGTADFGPPLGDTSFVTLGTLWKGDPKKLGGWDYTTEMALQLGEVSGRDLTAFAGHWAVGYNWLKLPWKPRIGVQYNLGSGDSDPTDGDIGTFQNLYPTNHLFYGFIDTTGWINMHNPQLNLTLNPTPKVKLMLDYHLYWNLTNDDAWYRVNGVTRVRPLTPAARSASRFRGQELDLTCSWKFNPHASMLAGYNVYFAGDYLKDTGTADNAHFAYLQLQFDF